MRGGACARLMVAFLAAGLGTSGIALGQGGPQIGSRAEPMAVPAEVSAAARVAGQNATAKVDAVKSDGQVAGSRAVIEKTPLGKPVVTGAADGTTGQATPASLGGGAVRTATALIAVLMLLLGCALLVKWMGRKGYLPSNMGGGMLGAGSGQARAVPGLVEILARYPVAGGGTLVVMKFDRRVLLINQMRSKGWRGPTEMTTLCELTSAEDVASVLLRTRAEEDSKRAAEFEAALRREDELMVREVSQEASARRGAARAGERVQERVNERGEQVQKSAPRVRAAVTGAALSPQQQRAPVQSLGGGRYA